MLPLEEDDEALPWLVPLEADENPEELLDRVPDELLLLLWPPLEELLPLALLVVPLLLPLPEPEELPEPLLPLPPLPPLFPPTNAQVPLAHSKPLQQSSVVVHPCPELRQTPPPLELEPEPPCVQPKSQARPLSAATASCVRFRCRCILALLARLSS